MKIGKPVIVEKYQNDIFNGADRKMSFYIHERIRTALARVYNIYYVHFYFDIKADMKRYIE